ncbi:MAG TPA: DUF4097 family beta strand repeat-containing protein [Flavisolibacter sp.]|nr:DUF4097 family beta strand repeat-containing protein [Flavisolibacter sp.]
MKKSSLLLALLITFAFLQAHAQNDKVPFMTKPLTADQIKNVQVETSGGSISVASVASDARIEVYITPNNSRENLSKEEIQKMLDEKYELKVEVSGNTLSARARAREKIQDWKKALNISFRVYTGKNVSTDLTTSGGSISLSNISGKQEFTTSGGSLTVDGVSGKVNGVTSGGSIQVTNSRDEIDLTTSGGSITATSTEGNLRLSTSGGSLHLDDLKGTIKATTSGGSVQASNIQGQMNAFTSGGSIQMSQLACSLETGTSGGNISVSFKELGQYVKISNSGGNINLELPKSKGVDLKLYANRIKTDALSHFDGKMDDDQLEGKLNGGGIPVSATAGSGRITLSLK